MQSILVIYSHPNPLKSKLNKALLNAVASLDGVTIRDLYQHYPDFDIDIKVEQNLVEHADVILFQHPVYWYSCPAIMKEWLDVVLQNGFAYGDKGSKLKGKKWLSAISTGGNHQSYSPKSEHFYSIEEFLRPFERTAVFCGMEFLPAFISHDAHHLNEQLIEAQTQKYRNRLKKIMSGEK